MDVCTAELATIVGVLKKVMMILQIGIPIILLIFGAIDLGKAVMAGDEKEIKAATGLLIKRVIAALAVFLLFILVSAVTGLVGHQEWRRCWQSANVTGKIDSGV